MKKFFLATILLCSAASAQFNGCQPGLCNGDSSSAFFPGIVPNGYDCNYSSGLYYPSQSGCGLTVSRTTTNGSSTVSDSLGNWSQVANNLARIGAGNGLLVEEARTNGIRNNSMQGASAGTPPTNWTNNGTQNGVIVTVGAPVVINGINCLPVTFSGTATANNTAANFLVLEAATVISATYGQTWTYSLFAFSSGPIPQIVLNVSERNSGGGLVTDKVSSPTVVGAAQTSVVFTTTLTGVATNFVAPRFFANLVNGTTYSGTIWLGWPQIENNSLINSAVASGAQTISNSGTSTCASGTYTVVGGTGTAATLTGVATAGVITSLTQLTPGSYTVFPPSPVALTGTGCSGSPTVTLTPANNAAQGFATSPIVTTSAAGVRGADVVTLTTPPTFGASYSEFASSTPFAPVGYSVLQANLEINDGTSANRISNRRSALTGVPVLSLIGGTGGTVVAGGSPVWAQNALGKVAASFSAGGQNFAFNGTNSSASLATLPPGPNKVYLGSVGVGTSNYCGCYEARIALWPTTAISSTQLQSITTLP